MRIPDVPTILRPSHTLSFVQNSSVMLDVGYVEDVQKNVVL